MSNHSARSGPKKHSGRIRQPSPQTRSEAIKVSLRMRELDDLIRVGEAWDMPPSTVAWALIADGLARMRKEAPDLADLGVAAARYLAQTGAVVEPPPE